MPKQFCEVGAARATVLEAAFPAEQMDPFTGKLCVVSASLLQMKLVFRNAPTYA